MKHVNFLQEQPAELDEFEGAHQQVAQSLYELINSKKGKPCMIALEGNLGSGKSTVLKILEEKLKPSSFEMFVFDCFKYQNGPIRRAFFERFYLCLKNLVCKCKHKKLRELKLKATGRVQESEDVDKYHLRFLPLFFTASLPLSAATLLMLGQGNLSKIYNLLPPSLSNWISENFLLGAFLVLVFLPIILIIPGAFCSRLVLDIANKAGKKNSRTVLLSTTEVTSTDLAEYYDQFLGLLPDKKKIVIVLDNIDRLDSEDIFDVWADMEIFSRGHNGNSNWVIVPYAPEQLRHAFSERYKSSTFWKKEGRKNIVASNTNNKLSDFDVEQPDGEKGKRVPLLELNEKEKRVVEQEESSCDMAEEFLNKWFTLRYRVPSILLSDWKKYFSIKWQQVFTESSEEERQQVLTLFQNYKRDSQHVTPRNIKHFINDVAVCWSSTTENEMDRLVVAAYRLLINHFHGDLLSLFSDNPEYTEHAFSLMRLIDRNWQESMAALHHNTQRKRARQIILNQPMEDAINQMSDEKFGKLIALDGGPDCLAELLRKNREFKFLERAFIVRYESGVSERGEIERLLKTELLIYEGYDAFQEPSRFVKSLESILDKNTKVAQVKSFYDRFSSQLMTADQSECKYFLFSINSLILHLEEKEVLEISAKNLVNVWLHNREKFDNIEISSFSQGEEIGRLYFQELITKWDEIETDQESDEIPWSPLDILELGQAFPAGTWIDYSAEQYPTLEDTNIWFNRVQKENVSGQVIYLLTLLYDEDLMGYGDLLQLMLHQDHISSFSSDNRQAVLLGLFALTIKAGQVSEYNSYFSALEFDDQQVVILKNLFRTSCSYFQLTDAIRNAGNEGISMCYNKLLAISIQDKWYHEMENVAFEFYLLYKDLVNREMLEKESLWHWIDQYKEDIITYIKEEDIDSLSREDAMEFLEDAVRHDKPFHMEVKDILVARFFTEENSCQEWEALIETASEVHKFTATLINLYSLRSRSLAQVIENIVQRELIETTDSVDFEFMASCARLLLKRTFNLLVRKMKKLILAEPTENNISVINRIVSCFKDCPKLMEPVDVNEIMGLCAILRLTLHNIESYSELVSYLAENANDIAQKIGSISQVETRKVGQLLGGMPPYGYPPPYLYKAVCKIYKAFQKRPKRN